MSESETKVCPWCGESIRAAALICRYCHGDATPRGAEAAGRFASGESPLPDPASGAAAAGASPGLSDPVLERLGKFIPGPLLESILEGASRIDEGERRPISIMFADLCGFTPLTEQIGAEAMKELLEVVYAEIRQIVERYGGVVEKFLGDAVMALFGAPAAHGDDAERAILAGLGIREAIRRIGKEHKRALDTHTGIAFGEVVFVSDQSGRRLDYQAIGDAVNLAARLQGKAKEGQILVDHRTHAQVRARFRWGPEASMPIKGQSRPARTHEVESARPELGRRPGERIEMAPLVGRGLELQLMLEAVGRSKDGKARVILIRGEAGVGKSRLLAEMLRRLPEDGFSRHTGYCLSFGASMPFHPFCDLLHDLLGISKTRETPVDLTRLEAAVRACYAPRGQGKRRRSRESPMERQRIQRAYESAALVLGRVPPEGELLALSPAERRRALFDGLSDLFAAAAGARPAVFAFEDFQWADSDSCELLDHLILTLQQLPVSIIILTRPETAHSFPMQEDFTRVVLHELGAEESETLLGHLLGTARIPRRLRDRILEKTEGNPFYIEEVLLDLEDRGAIARRGGRIDLLQPVESIQIPDTVEGVVLARLDRLESSIKSILRCAAVIGQEFRYRTLAHVTDLGERLREHLLSLVKGDYLLQRVLIPELIYIFRHVVLRDVAYSTMLEKKRREIHARVAEALEGVFAGQLDEYAELIAFHYERGGSRAKALEFLERAALKCEALYANHAARDHWERLLAILDQAKSPDDAQLRLALRSRLRLEEILRNLGRPEDAAARCEQALGLAEKLRDRPAIIDALCSASEAYRMTGKIEQGARALARAVKLARQTRDPALIASACNFFGHFERARGNLELAAKHFEEVAALSAKLGDRKRQYQALNHLGIVHMHRGEVDQANESYEKALALARELGRRTEQVTIEVNLGINNLRLGKTAAAQAQIARAQAHAEKIEYEYGRELALLALSDLLLKTGEPRKALAPLENLLQRNRETDFRDLRAVALTNKARAALWLGDLKNVAKPLAESAELAAQDGNYVALMDGLAVESEWLLTGAQSEKAAGKANELTTMAEKFGEQEFLALSHSLAARAHAAAGDGKLARESAEKALRVAREARIPREEAWALYALCLADRNGGGPTAKQSAAAAEALRAARAAGDAGLIARIENELSSFAN